MSYGPQQPYYEPQPQPTYQQPPPQPYYAPPAPMYAPRHSRFATIFTDKVLAGLIIGIIAGILILVGVFGSWASGGNFHKESGGYPYPEYIEEIAEEIAPPMSGGLSIGEIHALYDTFEMLASRIWRGRMIEGSIGGATYSLLYILIPCGIIVLLFSILMPLSGISSSGPKHYFATLVIIFSIIAVLISISGIVFILIDKVGIEWTATYYDEYYTIKAYSTFDIGYAGIVALVGGILGIAAGVILLYVPRVPQMVPTYQYPQPPPPVSYPPPEQPYQPPPG